MSATIKPVERRHARLSRKRLTMRSGVLGGWCLLILAATAAAEDLRYKEELLNCLVDKVPGIIESFDRQTGRFGTGVWTCQDQHPMYALAVAYATPGKENRYYKSPELLEVILKAGDLLIEKADRQGRWVFRKKDGSTWGMIWMPWTYSRWIRTFGLVADDMPADTRRRWAEALRLGYAGISKHALGHVHNIPTHHAMGLYAAGRFLEQPEWCRQAAEFMHKVVAAQSEAGYWSEGGGPVVRYNMVYVDALGIYYALSGDREVLPVLERAAVFHRHFTYPSGQNVETIDGRNPLEVLFPSADSRHPLPETVALGNVGFSFSAVGRAYLKRQWELAGVGRLNADMVASLILYGQEGPVEEHPDLAEETYVLREGGFDRAATFRKGPWFVCLSAFTSPIVSSRWIQDRQNFVSIYHDSTGVILGGGNTKLQPAWSTFSVGDMSLLKHAPGDQRPVFTPKGELYHVPSKAVLVLKPRPGLDLVYGPAKCRVRLQFEDDRTLWYRLEVSNDSPVPVAAHLTLIPRMYQTLRTGGGVEVTIGRQVVELSAEQVGGRIDYDGYRLHLPELATLHWPALPHNPYRKDGHAEPQEGRIEIRIPFPRQRTEQVVGIEILAAGSR